MTQKRAPRITLSRLVALRLLQLIEAEYVSRGETDSVFAKYASGVFSCEINDRHIQGLRAELGIPPTTARVGGLATKSLRESIAALTTRVEKLEAEWNATSPRNP